MCMHRAQRAAIGSDLPMLLVLAAINFTSLVDFLIIMPLGPQYMRLLNITSAQFGLTVSAYGIAAGLAGILVSIFLDRMDRKIVLLGVYAGFTLATLFCGLVSNYPLLVAGRALTGGFGGVLGAVIFAIVADVIPEERRGAAMGLVMSSLAMAFVFGVPLGVSLAVQLSWRIPFFALAGLSFLIWSLAVRYLPSIRMPIAEANEQQIARMLKALSRKDHQKALLLMVLMTGSCFLVLPYLSNYMIANVGIKEADFPLMYLCGGFCTIFSVILIGRWADHVGKPRVFCFVSWLAILAVLLLTNLPRVPVAAAVVITTFFMVCISGRSAPGMALVAGAVEPRYRGSFMSLNSSIQQITSGIVTYFGGLIIGKSATGEMTNFPLVGVVAVGCAFLSICLARFLKTRTVQTTGRLSAA
jgi:predicted MFS family arabinose efflux permease